MAEDHRRRCRRPQVVQASSRSELGPKLIKIVSRHEQVKIAFHQLQSQIRNGLLEAEDVLASLAIPLMKLVGLKTMEMAKEGRFSTIVVDPDSHVREEVSGSSTKSPTAMGEGDQHRHFYKLKEENFTAKARKEGQELVDKQRMQILQLVHLLKKIEIQVNSRKDDMLQVLADHKDSLGNIFQKVTSYLTMHHSHHDQEIFSVTVQILEMIFRRVSGMLCSVEIGVEKLMRELAEQMCKPMVEYVKGIKTEVEKGACMRLLAAVDEVGEAIKCGRLELEEARRKERVAEERKTEALIMLRDTEERVKKVNKCLELVSNAHKRSTEQFASHMLLGMEENKKKKRNRGRAESPMGPKELLCPQHRYRTRSSVSNSSPWALTLSPQTQRMDFRIPLGSSPSVSSNISQA